jgi:hypothetical protein
MRLFAEALRLADVAISFEALLRGDRSIVGGNACSI